MKAFQAQHSSPHELLLDIEQYLFQGLGSPVEGRSSSGSKCDYGHRVTDFKSFRQCGGVDDSANFDGVETCYSTYDNPSLCENSSNTELALQEDFSLSQDDDAPFSDPPSDENDEDCDMYEVLFGEQGSGRQQFSDNFIPESSLESEETTHSGRTEQTHLEEEVSAQSNGTRLVHLLLAAAQSLETCNLELASVILERLEELVSYSGSSIQRVGAYFCEGLRCRMKGIRACDCTPKYVVSSRDQFLTAFQLLHELSPYTKFSYFTANQAILEAIDGHSRVHIVDYEIAEGVQWSSLMQSLASRKDGPPHLKVTALCRPHIKRGMATVQETGSRLSEFASTLNISFSFNQVRLDKDEEFCPSAVKILKGEALVGNCMLHMPHMPYRAASSVSSFFLGMRQLSPAIVTLVREELDCGTASFTNNFIEALYHYSAIFDSLEASASAHSAARLYAERLFLAPRILSLVTGFPADQSADQNDVGRRNWCSLMGCAGFVPVSLSAHNRCQARLLQGLFVEGFQIAEGGDCLRLGWCSNPLFAATAWRCSS